MFLDQFFDNLPNLLKCVLVRVLTVQEHSYNHSFYISSARGNTLIMVPYGKFSVPAEGPDAFIVKTHLAQSVIAERLGGVR